MDALLRAAAELFSQQGVRATTVRQVARLAGVNHGLVHHYFGSKRALLEATLERLAAAHPDLPAGAGRVDAEAVQLVERHWRILAFAILEDEDPAALQQHFPLFDKMLDGKLRSGLDRHDARLEVAGDVAAQLGWHMFRRLVVRGLQLDEDECSQVDRRVFGQVEPALPA